MYASAAASGIVAGRVTGPGDVDGNELDQAVAGLVQQRYQPDQWRAVSEEHWHGFVVEPPDGLFLIRAIPVSNPYVWISAGVAMDVLRSPALSEWIAGPGNRELMVGRAFLDPVRDPTNVVMDEKIFGAALSLEFRPSIVDLVSRLESLLDYAAKMRNEIVGRFGGRAFNGEDWLRLETV